MTGRFSPPRSSSTVAGSSRRYAALLRRRRGQYPAAADRAVARVRAPPSDHDRNAGREREASEAVAASSIRSLARANGSSGQTEDLAASGRARRTPRRQGRRTAALRAVEEGGTWPIPAAVHAAGGGAEAVDRALQKNAEAAGINDSAWQSDLSEIREQLDRALTPELRDRLSELQQALKELDADRTKEALEQLAEPQRQLREALERSRELFRRAAIEGDLANLARSRRSWRRSSAVEPEVALRTASRAATPSSSSRSARTRCGASLEATRQIDGQESARQRAT